jgi:hypothetical protein
MTDQATEQSGQQVAAPTELNSNDLAAMFSGKSETEQQPQGQASTVEGVGQEAESGESPEQSEAEAQAEAPAEKFKVPALEGDGFDELTAEELKAQRLMHADYTRKTQQVAEARKQAEAEVAQARQVMTQKAQAMEDNLVALGQAIKSFDAQVNWEALREVDPATYLAEREKQQARQQHFMTAAKQLEAFRREQAEMVKQQNAQRLVEAIPTWLDPTVAKKEAEEVRSYLTKTGYQPDEIEGLTDYRVIVMARELARYEALKNKASEVKAQVQKAPQLAKPGAVRPGNPEALAKYRTTQKAINEPSKDNLAALFAKL